MRELLAKQGDTAGDVCQNIATPTREWGPTYERIDRVSHGQVFGETDKSKPEGNTKTREGVTLEGVGPRRVACNLRIGYKTSASSKSTNKSLGFLKPLRNE